MLTVALGLTAALFWGSADFLGGLQSRRLPALSVVFWSQLAGGTLLLLMLAALHRSPVLSSILWGFAGGIAGGIALVLFYRALAVGLMSIVAPVSACGVLVPVVYSLLTGSAPGLLASLGIAAAIAGIILVSLHSGVETAVNVRPLRYAVALSLASALGFGAFYVLLDQGAAGSGASPLWAAAGVRAGSVTTLVLLVATRRGSALWPGGRIVWISAVGILDTSANVLYAYALTQGNLGVVAVLTSLYPVTTVLLGRAFLSERLVLLQAVGVALALTGVLLLSTAPAG